VCADAPPSDELGSITVDRAAEGFGLGLAYGPAFEHGVERPLQFGRLLLRLDPAPVAETSGLPNHVTPDGESYAYSYTRQINDLYMTSPFK
jgi:hypothetical protein